MPVPERAAHVVLTVRGDADQRRLVLALVLVFGLVQEFRVATGGLASLCNYTGRGGDLPD